MNDFERAEFFVCLETEFPSPLFELLKFRYIERYSIWETCEALGLKSVRQFYNLDRRIDRKRLRRLLDSCINREV
ncbi:MAG: hypothetical protein A2Y33_06330 [Spirochaetes bacterium GWF1_51_8]|nr:MAG: hypothetical protein A2Y33_06330 [Spirochaetes bacterium GWF1_51_8]